MKSKPRRILKSKNKTKKLKTHIYDTKTKNREKIKSAPTPPLPPPHQQIHHNINKIFSFLKKRKLFSTNPPSKLHKLESQLSRGCFKQIRRGLWSLRHDECNENFESARCSRANWMMSAIRLGFGVVMRHTLAMAIARIRGLGI